MGTLSSCQIVLAMRKNGQGELASRLFQILNTAIYQKTQQKTWALYISSIDCFPFRFHCLKAGELVVQSRVLIHSSLILFSCFSLSYISLRNKQLKRGRVGKV